MHHEQACGFAAECDYRVTGRPSVVCVTAGPGGTNTLTAVASAYVDSIPLIVISGQVASHTLKPDGHRQRGMNELDMVTMARGITKFSVTVTEANRIHHHLNAAWLAAMCGRPGPVWIDIPIDIQGARIDPRKATVPEPFERTKPQSSVMEGLLNLLGEAKRPVCIVGNGVRLADAANAMTKFLQRMQMPIVTSWGARDLVASNPLVIGSCGLFGNRAANFAVQSADLILAIGTRLSVPMVGHHPMMFAPKAKTVLVEIDPQEISRKDFDVDLLIKADALRFFDATRQWPEMKWPEWLDKCIAWGYAYSTMAEYGADDSVNAYFAMHEIARHMDPDAIVVTDVGASFLPAFQAMPLKRGQRLIHSAGVSAMGYGLPAAIGAAFATEGKRQVICLTGDGGLMMNLQELQTIAHHKLPIAIYVFENQGYMTMRIAQRNHFKREAIAGPESGLSCPDFEVVAQSFGLSAFTIINNDELRNWSRWPMDQAPFLCQLRLDPDQEIAPKVQTKVENGQFIATPLEDMYPYLPKDVLAKEMGNGDN